MSDLYIYSRIQANGVRVVTDHLEEACQRAGISCRQVRTLDNVPKDALVVAYGVKENVEQMHKGFRTELALLVDAVSLGFRNKVRFYLKNGYLFHYDFFYSIYAYLKWRRREKRVLQAFRQVMLVSQTDINYLKQLAPKAKCRYLLVQNGANLPDSPYSHNPANHFRLGLLASWGNPVTYAESAWFVEKWFSRYAESHPETFLYLAGRVPFIERLQGRKNVVVLGEVPDLADFFSNIDLFLVVNPKGCGVLNRALDAFAYQVPVAALPASMSGFEGAEDCYIPFTDYASFVEAIERGKDLSMVEEMAGAMKDYLKRCGNWQENYTELAATIKNFV